MNEIFLGEAYWNQRETLAHDLPRIEALFKAINKPTDLAFYVWTELIAFVLEYKPDLILELGRGLGNSTCAFAEAASLMKPSHCHISSLCLSDDWEKTSLPKISKLISGEWLANLEIHRTDILDFNYEALFKKHDKILIFWDAHGFEIAETVLGRILPLIQKKSHAVIMHDMSDARYLREGSHLYYGNSLWRGKTDFEGPRVRLGNINSAVEQAVAIVDFTSRNKIPLNSAGHGLHSYFDVEPAKKAEMVRLLGAEACRMQGDYFWFTLNAAQGPFTYPTIRKRIRFVPEVSIQQRPSRPRGPAFSERFDLDEKKRVFKRILREAARSVDKFLLGATIYNKFYLPNKKKKDSE